MNSQWIRSFAIISTLLVAAPLLGCEHADPVESEEYHNPPAHPKGQALRLVMA
jgi:hypothetical protein